MEAALASRLLRLGVSLEWVADYAEGGVGGFSSGALVRVEDGADVDAAIDVLSGAMTAAPRERIIGWLAELSVRIIRRPQDEFSDGLTIEVYSRELTRYPADVVRGALFSGWRYWPALDAELLPRCERLVAARRAAIARLREGGGDAAAGENLDAKERVTPQRAREIIAEVLSKRGMP